MDDHELVRSLARQEKIPFDFLNSSLRPQFICGSPPFFGKQTHENRTVR
jgi:hypothetical protein